MNDKSQLNGNAATLALAEALSGVIKEAVAPLDAKVDALEAKVDRNMRALIGRIDHLNQRFDALDAKIDASQ